MMAGIFPGLGRSPGEGKGYPLQYSGLEDSMDCIILRISKSRTRLSDFYFHFHFKEWWNSICRINFYIWHYWVKKKYMNLWFCTIKLYHIVFVQFFISIFNVWECSFPQRIISTVYYYQIWIFVNLLGKKWCFSVVLIWIYLIVSGVLFHLHRDHFSLYMNHVFIPSVCSYNELLGLPRWHWWKRTCRQCRRHNRHGFDPWVGKIPWRRPWPPTVVFLSGESLGQEPGGLQSMGSHRVGPSWRD